MTRAPLHIVVAIIVAVTVCGGCASGAGFGRARVLDAGAVEVGVGTEVGVIGVTLGPGPTTQLPTLLPAAFVRGGVRDGLELGARAWWFPLPGTTAAGASVDVKLRVLRTALSPFRLDGSSDIALVVHRLDVGGAGTNALGLEVRPLLLGLGNDTFELSIVPRMAAYVLVEPSVYPATFGLVGCTIALRGKLTDRISIVPEVRFDHTPVSWNGLGATERRGADFFGLGLSVVVNAF